MKTITFIFCVFLFGISCTMSPKERPYYLLTKYSELDFNKANIHIVNFKEEMSGMTKNQGIREALFRFNGLNNDSLRKEMLKLGYKSLPINELVMGNDTTGNLRPSDTGYYKLNILKGSIIDLLVVINFTQGNVTFYKLIQ